MVYAIVVSRGSPDDSQICKLAAFNFVMVLRSYIYIHNSQAKRQSITTMPSTFTHEFNASAFKAKVSFSTGIFINGQFLDGSDNTTIEYYDLPLSLINY